MWRQPTEDLCAGDDVRRGGRAGSSQQAQAAPKNAARSSLGRGVSGSSRRGRPRVGVLSPAVSAAAGISRPWDGTRDGRSRSVVWAWWGAVAGVALPARERRRDPGLAAHVRRALARPASGRRSKGLDGGVSASAPLVVRDGATGRRWRGRNERPSHAPRTAGFRPGWSSSSAVQRAPERLDSGRHDAASPSVRARRRIASGVRPRCRAAWSTESNRRRCRSRASSSAVHRRPYVARPSRRARAATAFGVRGVSSAAICSHVRPRA